MSLYLLDKFLNTYSSGINAIEQKTWINFKKNSLKQRKKLTKTNLLV
jgi:hypothetical protein